MLRRKATTVGAVAVMFISSIVGATVLRAPDGNALDEVEDMVVTLEETEDAIGEVPQAIVEAVEPVLTGGVGESLILVIAAQVPAAEVQSRLAEINSSFGELQGFSVDAADNYELTGAYVNEAPDAITVACTTDMGCPEGLTAAQELQPAKLRYTPLDTAVPSATSVIEFVPGQSLIVSGFRTKQGAEEFLDLARAVGVTELITVQARKRGGGDIGLGQEPHPDGSGPLMGPLSDQEAFQR